MPHASSAPDVSARQRILDAAGALFAEYGFDATSTKAIAEAAGVPSGLIFYHFANKDALLQAIFAGENILGALESAFAAAEKERRPQRALRVLVAVLYTWLDRHAIQARILFKEISSHRPISHTFRGMRKNGISRLAAFLRRRFRTNKRLKCEVAAQIIASSLLFAVVLDRPENVNRYLDDLVGTVVPE